MGSPFTTSVTWTFWFELRRALAKEEGLRLLRQELPCLRVAHVQTVVVDDRCLMFQPLLPARLADRIVDAIAQVGRKGRCGELGVVLLAAFARYVGHGRECNLAVEQTRYQLSLQQ